MILAGYPSRNVDILDENRDKRALGMALVTLPISIVSSLAGSDIANATQAPEHEKDGKQDLSTDAFGVKPVVAAATPILSSVNQLTYTVRAGDTITQIARKFQLSSNQLLQINNLQANSLLVPGQKLKLVANAIVPASQSKANAATVHVVKRGDTVNSIAKQHGISITTVLAMNKLSATAIIFPGQRLLIGSVIPKHAKAPVPIEHLVEPGETLASIANFYGIDLNNLLSANGFNESSLVYGGQMIKLRIPGAPITPETNPLARSADTFQAEGTSSDQAPLGVNSLGTNSMGAVAGGLNSQDPHRPSDVCQTHGFHTVKTGESVSKIAAVYGLSTQSILSANNLSWTSMIYVGQKLIIPGVHEIKFCPDLEAMTAEMKSNAAVIYKVGRELNVSDYGIVIALAAAMQESNLRNLSYGDRDSVGLFQQRPSAHWGQVEQIMNPEYAARAFFGGKTSPTYGAARGLLDIKDWSSKSLTEAAQAVQVSAYPNAYAKWEASAWVWLDQLASESDQVNLNA
jgi:LysM repeat protein